MIIWNTRERNPRTKVKPKILSDNVFDSARFILTITPKTSGIYQINVHKEFRRHTGPLLDKMLVTKPVLARLVLTSVVNAEQEIMPPSKRRQFVQDRSKFIKTIQNSAYYSSSENRNTRLFEKSFK